MQSAAFFESDVKKLTEIALSFIPEDCDVARAVRCAFQSYESGKTWQEARIALFQETPSSFGQPWPWIGKEGIPVSDICPLYVPEPEVPIVESGYDAPWSIGAIVIALLYGEGDFGKTICTATNMGEDTDCTAGTAGSIIGIVLGAENIPEKWKTAVSNRIATCTLRTDVDSKFPKTIEELAFRVVRLTPEFLREKCVFAGVEKLNGAIAPDWSVGGYEVLSEPKMQYDKDFFAHCNTEKESVVELLQESPYTVRRHFPTLTVTVKYDENFVSVKPNGEKRFRITFINKLFTPQFFNVKLLNVEDDWTTDYGTEFCVGVEHLHGGSNRTSIDLTVATPTVKRASYTIVMEISSIGRSGKYYFPITLLNGIIDG